MKKRKYLVFMVGFLLLARGITVLFVRTPSYTIQTTGKLYIVNKLSSDIRIFDLFQGKEITEIPIKTEPHDIATLSDQSRVVVTNYGNIEIVGNSITVINTKTNTIEKIIELQGSLRPHGIVAFKGSNKVGVVTNEGNDLLLVNVDSGIIEKEILTQQRMSHLVVLDPNKPFAYVTNVNSNSVSVIDFSLNKVIKNINCGLGTLGIDITPDGSEIWVTNSKENSINVIDTDTFEITHTLKTGNEPLKLKFSVDGKYSLVANLSDGSISVYNQQSKKNIKTIDIPGKKKILERILYHTPRPVYILMHPNGLYAFISNSNANQVEVIDMKTFEIVSNIRTGKIPDGLAYVE
ncbi:MAG: hypothetical protein NWQ07_03655 [Flaviramulus sp.]|nr:hypothetical protein [Flaviramulus sp.]